MVQKIERWDDGPLFRPLKHDGKRRDERRGMDPEPIDRVVRKYAAALGLDPGPLGALDARDLRQHGARKRRAARTCRRLPSTVTRAPRSSMIGGDTTRRRQRASS
jgi:hypothetical protein